MILRLLNEHVLSQQVSGIHRGFEDAIESFERLLCSSHVIQMFRSWVTIDHTTLRTIELVCIKFWENMGKPKILIQNSLHVDKYVSRTQMDFRHDFALSSGDKKAQLATKLLEKYGSASESPMEQLGVDPVGFALGESSKMVDLKIC